MNKVPQLMSDRPRHKANAGKFIVERLRANHRFGVLCMPIFDDDADGEAVTIFDTLDAADAAASLINDKAAKPDTGPVLICRTVQLVARLGGDRIYRPAAA